MVDKKKYIKLTRRILIILLQKRIQINAYYLQIGELHPRVGERDTMVFYKELHTVGFLQQQMEFDQDITRKRIQRKIRLQDL